MRQLKALALPGKNHGVIAHHVTAAHRVNSDLRLAALAHYSFTTMAQDFRLPGALQNFNQCFCRSAWRIFLHPVMRFDNFQIEILAENFRSVFGQGEERVYSDAEVRGEDNRNLFRRCDNIVALFRGMTCGPNY